MASISDSFTLWALLSIMHTNRSLSCLLFYLVYTIVQDPLQSCIKDNIGRYPLTLVFIKFMEDRHLCN